MDVGVEDGGVDWLVVLGQNWKNNFYGVRGRRRRSRLTQEGQEDINEEVKEVNEEQDEEVAFQSFTVLT